jgi:hypothetical protein
MLSTLFLNATSVLGPGFPRTSVNVTDVLNTEFIYNEVRNNAEMQYYVGRGVSLLFAHRYAFTDVTNNDSEDTVTTDMSRRGVDFGVVYRPASWLRLGLDYEDNKVNHPIERTDLFDYNRVNFDWQVGTWKGFSFNGRIWHRNNEDPAADIDLHDHYTDYSAGLNYDPNERISLGVDYTHTDLASDLLFVIPQNLTTARSVFNERVNGFGGRLTAGIYKGVKAELGYRGVINRGSYPLEFHQPYGSLWIPLGHSGLAFKPTWQYFGYNQTLFNFESYQTHLVTLSLVYAR